MTTGYTGAAKDPLLDELVAFAEDNEFPGGVTLVVDGALISGVLVSGAKYLQHYWNLFNERLRELGQNELHGKFVPKFEEGAKWRAARGRGAYVHLRDVRVRHPGAPESVESPDKWWRIPLESVDGFALEPPPDAGAGVAN